MQRRSGIWVLSAIGLCSAALSLPGRAEPGTSWLQLEQRTEQYRLEADQRRFIDSEPSQPAPQAAGEPDIERRLQRQRQDQQIMFDRQMQEQMQFDRKQRINPSPVDGQRRRIQQQRVQQQNNQMRQHLDLQRRSWP